MSDLEKIIAEMRRASVSSVPDELATFERLNDWADRLDSLRPVPEVPNDLRKLLAYSAAKTAFQRQENLPAESSTGQAFINGWGAARQVMFNYHEANPAPPTSGNCYRPEQRCPNPASCRENGCNAVERENLKATPAQALGEVLELRQLRDSSSPLGYVDHHLKFAQAVVAIVDEHGQHFAGLEAENSTAIADIARLLSRTVELNDALDSADARVLELKSALLRYGRHEEVCETRHDTAYKPKPKCTCGFAAFLAAKGETK